MQSNRTPLSIVIPSKNPLKNATFLKLYAAQADFIKLNLVIVFDVDAMSGEMKSLAENLNSENVSVFSGKFGSAGSARNYGISKVRSTWVAFCDDDDIADFSNFKTLTFQAIQLKSDIGVGKILIKFKNKKDLDCGHYESTESIISFARFPGFTRMVFRRDLFDQIKFSELKVAEDIILLANIFQMNVKFHFSSLIVYKITLKSNQQKRKYHNHSDDILNALQLLNGMKTSNKKICFFVSIQKFRLLRMLLFYTKIRIFGKLLSLKYLNFSDFIFLIRYFRYILSNRI